MHQLSLKQRRILYHLDLDARQSNAEIGKRVGVSKQVVDYQIRQLVKEGFITRFATVVDTYRLGLLKYKVYLSLQNANSSVVKDIITYLVRHRKTEWIATCSGRFDIIAGYLVRNVYEFDEALKEFDERFNQYVAEKQTTNSLGVPHWRKEYLLDDRQPAPVVMQGGTARQTSIEPIEEELTKVLVNNGRMPVTEIARRIKTSARVAQYHLKKLKEQGIILMSRVFLDLNRFGWIYVKAIVTFKNLTKERYASFFTYCDGIRNLTYIINCVGAWDIELDFEIESFNRFHAVMLDLRDKFADIIKGYDFVIVMNEDKLDYYPGSQPPYE